MLYADDIKIFYKIRSPSDSTLPQSESDIFTEWVSHLGLTLNLSKCNVISFSISLTPILTTYFLNGTELERVYSIKDLGIIYSPNLCFSIHINSMVNRALKVLGFIMRIILNYLSRLDAFVLYTMPSSALFLSLDLWSGNRI